MSPSADDNAILYTAMGLGTSVAINSLVSFKLQKRFFRWLF